MIVDHYRQQIESGAITEDPQQLAALQQLQVVYDRLLLEQKKRRFWPSVLRRTKLVKGVYMWGSVGIGKTFLMDSFYHALPFTNKLRMHFHQFMRYVHAELRHHQGKKDPLVPIAKELASKAIVICFDELIVKDIADAMILGRLFKLLFAYGICLVTTSNTPPDNLYQRGLQRQQFLPAIALLKKHTSVIHLSTAVDYRLRHLDNAGVYFIPDDESAQENMEKSFAYLAHDSVVTDRPVTICDRQIPIVKKTSDVIWFDFNTLCSPPRSQHDYLALSETYHTIFISHIRPMAEQAKNKINLFIRLVDVLYDKRIRLVFSAAVPVEQLYPSGELSIDFQRTISRLLEMQSQHYYGSHASPEKK